MSDSTQATDGDTPLASTETPQRGCGGFLLVVALFALGFFLVLRGVAGEGLVFLTAFGALATGLAFLVFRTWSSTAARFVGVLLLVVATFPLVLRAPDAWLDGLPFGELVREGRVEQLKHAIDEGDAARVKQLAALGISEPRPRDGFGSPLLDDVDDPELLGVLLAAGLDPDIRDERERTPLMNARDAERVRRLLEGGADPNARDDLDRTPLVYAAFEDPAIVEHLLGAGADPVARDRLGRFVADYHAPGTPARRRLDAAAGGAAPTSPQGLETPNGLTAWVLETDLPPGSSRLASSITLQPEAPALGDVVRAQITIANTLDEALDLEIEADLNTATFFVGASDGGRIAVPDLAPIQQTIRWPMLHLPARSLGRLELQVLARRPAKGDLGVTVMARALQLVDGEMVEIGLSAQANPGAVDRPGAARAAVGWVVFFWLVALAPFALLVVWALAMKSQHPRRWLLGRITAGAFALFLGWVTTSLLADAWRSQQGLEATTCTVLDRRVEIETYTSSSTRGSRSTTTTRYDPLLALRYEVAGRTIVSSGFAANTASGDRRDLEQFAPGAEVACWFDPETPDRVVVRRGVSGGSLVLFGFLGLAAIGLAWVAKGGIPWHGGGPGRRPPSGRVGRRASSAAADDDEEFLGFEGGRRRRTHR